jgi:hypothetical protein
MYSAKEKSKFEARGVDVAEGSSRLCARYCASWADQCRRHQLPAVLLSDPRFYLPNTIAGKGRKARGVWKRGIRTGSVVEERRRRTDAGMLGMLERCTPVHSTP